MDNREGIDGIKDKTKEKAQELKKGVTVSNQ